MAKDAFIRARIESGLKLRVEGILSGLGLNMTDAINLFLHQVELRQGLPFEVTIPNRETVKALEESENIEGLGAYKDSNELFESWENL